MTRPVNSSDHTLNILNIAKMLKDLNGIPFEQATKFAESIYESDKKMFSVFLEKAEKVRKDALSASARLKAVRE